MDTTFTVNMNKRERAAMLDRLYRRLSQMDDSTLASLDSLVSAGDPVAFVAEAPQTQPSLGRRAFLLALLTGGAAAAGGGATLLFNRSTGEKTAPVPTLTHSLQGEPVPVPATPDPAQTIAALETQLASMRSERLALRAQLDSTRSTLDTTQQQATDLNSELEARRGDIAYLQQVIAVYEQIEAVDLDGTISAGLNPVSLALAAALTTRSLMQVGIQQAAAALLAVEVQAPAIANGLLWLEEQIAGLANALQNLEDILSGLVEPVKPAAQQIGDFIGQVLDLLPFGVGQNIRAGLEAVAAILTHIPELVASVNAQVITPLRQWVSPEADQGLVAEVVQPINANLIAPAQQMADETAALDTAFAEQLKTPVDDALARRAELRASLYRLTGVS